MNAHCEQEPLFCRALERFVLSLVIERGKISESYLYVKDEMCVFTRDIFYPGTLCVVFLQFFFVCLKGFSLELFLFSAISEECHCHTAVSESSRGGKG